MDCMKILKINEINVNTGQTWTIRAKVIKKSNIILYYNVNTHDGRRRFFINVSDSTGIIRMAAFGDEVDKFHSKIEINCLYTISGGVIKMANKEFYELDHDYEIILNRTTSVEKYECSTCSFHCNEGSSAANSINGLVVTQQEINPEIIDILKQNEEDLKCVSKRLAELDDLDEKNKIERQKLDSKIRRLTYERVSLLNRTSL